jgi:diguanylate cyclase (GGDEF)-like protein
MKTEMETVAQLQAKASWRVAVSQGLTLLGFKEWVIECTDYSRELCRKGEDDLIARVGSDEFVVVLTIDPSHHEAAKCVASSIIASTEGSLREPDMGRALSGSLGIALFPNHAADADSLMIAADRQRYEARRRGKGTISFAHG